MHIAKTCPSIHLLSLLSSLVLISTSALRPAGPIDLGDVTAGGDGSGNAPAANTGIDPRNGRFVSGYVDGPVRESDPDGDGKNPSPGASRFIDSVFFIDSSATPGAGSAQAITRSGVQFPFAFGDAAPEGGACWNYILRDRNGGVSSAPVEVGGVSGLASAVGIHASAGLTLDLNALRERHGAASVGCFSTFWGLDGCASGEVNLYAILSSDLGVIVARSGHFFGGGGAFMEPLEIPPGARYLTLATGASGDGTCDHGTFALAFITPGPCPHPSFTSLRAVSPSVILPEGGTPLLVEGDGFSTGLDIRVGGLSLREPQLLDSRRMRGLSPRLTPGVYDVEAILPGGPSVARLIGAVRVVGPSTSRTSFEETFPAAELTLEEIQMRPDGRLATRVTLRGAESAADVGFPVLPWIHRRLAIPAGATIAGAALNARPGAVFPGHSRVEWRQSLQPAQAAGRAPRPPEHALDPDGNPIYFPPPAADEPMHPSVLSAAVWPPNPVVVEGTAELGGFQIVNLRICPVSWSPLDGSISMLESASVTLFHDGGTPPTRSPDTYQLTQEQDAVRLTVINPNVVPPPTYLLRPPQTLEAWYLIITDDYLWGEAKKRYTSNWVGDLTKELGRLAEWKRQKGIRAEVVTMTDIIEKRLYGNFDTNGTRDTQEILRNFLKHARKNFGTYWVLLAGNTGIIPARNVVMHMGGGYTMSVQSSSTPAVNQAYADKAGQFFRVRSSEVANGQGYGTVILDPDTNTTYRYNDSAAPNKPGWYFVTDDTYATKASLPKERIRLYGPSTSSPPSVLYQAPWTNTIPTDLYYSSISSPLYDQPGLHDWDQDGNGVYGEFFENEDEDGVDFWANLALGRAPVGTASEAKAWVDKAIAYEKYEGLPAEFGRKLLFSSSNWWSPPAVSADAKNPPDKNKFYSAGGATDAHCHFSGAPGKYWEFDLIAYNSPSDYWVIPYRSDAGPSQLGYYYTLDPFYGIIAEYLGIPLPTEYVRVQGPTGLIHPKVFFFDYRKTDLSALEKESVKSLFESYYPEMDLRQRYYQDFEDTPGYPEPDLFELKDKALLAPLSSGYNIVSLSGHGWWTGCCGLDTNLANSLTNGVRGGMIYADSCLTNRFTMSDALSNAFLTSSQGGGVAYVGNSAFSWIGTGHEFEEVFWRQLGALGHLGWLHNTKWYLKASKYQKWANYSLNLLADPEMSLWVGTPERLDGDYPVCIKSTDSVHVTVTAGGSPLKGAFACLTNDKGLFALQTTSATGEAVFSGLPLQKGSYLVFTASARGLAPFQGYIGVDSLQCNSVLFYRGDSNGDDKLDLSDAVSMLNHLFLGARAPSCADAADVNDDGKVDISDPIRLLGFLFLGDPAPPGFEPGHPQVDTTPDGLDCAGLPGAGG